MFDGRYGQPLRGFGLAFSCVLAVLWIVPPAWSADPLEGVALVIGNGDYESLAVLPNPARDADDFEKLFDRLGFRTEATTNRDLRRLKRDLDDFVEDAEGADVAVLVYSGHGIEAGGENWLVPVDADLSAIEDAGEKLVPLSAIVKRLQANVPVVIVLLDACRDSPFPAGATLKVSAGSAPAAIAASGLGETRGAAPLGVTEDGRDNLGTVIGFSAAPGKPALDGTPGTNSPYAAAVLRHLDALAGTEFGTVMRMVAEEVYLKTGGRQRPWTNESLRRLLYFGKAPVTATGEEGDILAERRDLLLTIAALPDLDRRQIETVAAEGGVPMDALYAMLTALGAKRPENPAELDKLLRDQAEKIKQMITGREVLTNPDPEVQRLSKLANDAISEGALKTAIALYERAKARLKATEPVLDQTEAYFRARRIERSQFFAKSAAAYELVFDYGKAAEDYRSAFEQVETWDRKLAFSYKRAEANALYSVGWIYPDQLRNAVTAFTTAEEIMPVDLPIADRVEFRNELGLALHQLGASNGDASLLRRAIASYRAALGEISRDSSPEEWAEVQQHLAWALLDLGKHETGTTTNLHESIQANRSALAAWISADTQWRSDRWLSIGRALETLSRRDDDASLLAQAIDAYRTALELSCECMHNWRGDLQVIIGDALAEHARQKPAAATLEEAAAAYRSALEVKTRDTNPTAWAGTQYRLANVLRDWGEMEAGTARLEEAVIAYRKALEVQNADTDPDAWSLTQRSLAVALKSLGDREEGTSRYEQAIEAYRAALEKRPRDKMPLIRARTQYDMALAMTALGLREMNPEHFVAASTLYRAALEELTFEKEPEDWATVNKALGQALAYQGLLEKRSDILEEAIDILQKTFEVHTRESAPAIWADTSYDLGLIFRQLGQAAADSTYLQQATAAFRAVVEASSKADSPQLWLDGQGMLATTLAEFGARFGERSAILEANAIMDEIRSTLKAAGYSEQDIDGSYGDLAAQIRDGLRDLR